MPWRNKPHPVNHSEPCAQKVLVSVKFPLDKDGLTWGAAVCSHVILKGKLGQRLLDDFTVCWIISMSKCVGNKILLMSVYLCVCMDGCLCQLCFGNFLLIFFFFFEDAPLKCSSSQRRSEALKSTGNFFTDPGVMSQLVSNLTVFLTEQLQLCCASVSRFVTNSQIYTAYSAHFQKKYSLQ